MFIIYVKILNDVVARAFRALLLFGHHHTLRHITTDPGLEHVSEESRLLLN